jgi:hypothetical protein
MPVGDGGENLDVLTVQQPSNLPPDEFGIEVSEHPAQLCSPVLAYIRKELLECHSNGGTCGVTEPVTPALA